MKLAVITTYYNPSRYVSRYENYLKFRLQLLRHDVSLITMEQVGDQEKGTLQAAPGERVVTLCSKDVLWQKERLVNAAIAYVPPEFDAVAWVDADIIFPEEDWVRQVLNALDRLVAVQLFSQFVDVYPGDAAPRLLSPSTRSLLSVFGSREYGNPGLAWAARRDFVQEYGVYDAQILGSGDTFTSRAFLNDPHFPYLQRICTPRQTEYYLRWAERVIPVIGGHVGYVPLTLWHLWHGDKKLRLYNQRHQILLRHDFDPHIDIRINRNGCWEWATEKPELHREVAEYFERRAEDSSYVPCESTARLATNEFTNPSSRNSRFSLAPRRTQRLRKRILRA